MLKRGRRRARRGRGRTTVTAAYQASGVSRVERRKQRKRRQLTRGGAALAAVVVLAVLAGALLVRKAVTGGGDDGPRPRTQSTMLFAVKAADGTAQSSALLAYDPATSEGSMAFVPPTVLAQAPGVGRVPFERALLLGGAKAARGAVAEMLGVTVDDDWVLTRAGFGSLVDRVGGVDVDVDVDVIQSAGGRSVVLVTAGRQRLDGARAVAYATYVARGEDLIGSLPRLQRVLEAVLASAPEERQLVTVIGTLGKESASSAKPDALARFLLGLAGARRAEKMAFATLPVTVIDAGGGRQRYALDEVQAQELVRNTLASSVPPGRFDGDNRVILLNGVGTPGVTQGAQSKLGGQGFDIVHVGNANRFDYKASVVLIRDATSASTALGQRVASLLGLPASSVQIDARSNNVTDVIVIIGADYKPVG